jgi:hypothetical protein
MENLIKEALDLTVDVDIDECNYSCIQEIMKNHLRMIPNFLILVMGNVISLA